jgi:hypothetical protein
MTSFSYPLNIRNHEPPGPESVNLVEARVPGRYSVVVNTAKTGTAAAATTIPLFVAPAGSTFYECVLDVTTPFNNEYPRGYSDVDGHPVCCDHC